MQTPFLQLAESLKYEQSLFTVQPDDELLDELDDELEDELDDELLEELDEVI